MRIESSSIHTFYFPYEGHEIAIPVRASAREEACQKLLGFFSTWGLEISMEMPKVSPTLATSVPTAISNSPDPFVLQLRIEDLVKEVTPIKKPKGANTLEKLVREWTGFPYEPANYAAIISELENLKHGKN